MLCPHPFILLVGHLQHTTHFTALTLSVQSVSGLVALHALDKDVSW